MRVGPQISKVCVVAAVAALAEQIEYALDDVRYLLPLKAHLEEEINRLKRTAWLAEELRRPRDGQ